MKATAYSCKSAINRVSGRFPFKWDCNAYRGCSHRCQYCYAMYSQRYLESDFFDEIFYKENIAEVLHKELTKSSWKHEPINLGGVTDSYQPLEKKMELMPKILAQCIETNTPIILSTKSDLILRDLSYIQALSSRVFVNIAATITCQPPLASSLEPGAVSPDRRFAMLKAIKENTQAVTGVHMMPIIPYLTDNEENLHYLLSNAKQARVDYVLPGFLYLRGVTRPHFFNYLHQAHPDKEKAIKELFYNREKYSIYKKEFYRMFHALLQEYGLTTNYQQFMPKTHAIQQLSLFD